MEERTDERLTRALERARAGDQEARAELIAHVYEDLRLLARKHMSDQAEGHTLQTTALVHEAWLKMQRLGEGVWAGKSEFLRVAATAMRSVLVDHARARNTRKRGDGARRFELDEARLGEAPSHEVVLALHDALERLAEIDPELARVAELRLFLQLSSPEAAEVLGVSSRTLERAWRAARAWLERELAEA